MATYMKGQDIKYDTGKEMGILQITQTHDGEDQKVGKCLSRFREYGECFRNCFRGGSMGRYDAVIFMRKSTRNKTKWRQKITRCADNRIRTFGEIR